MNAPSRHTIVRHTFIPPQPHTIQAATAWRASVRPTRPRTPPRHLAALALCVALLAVFVWTLRATPEPIAVAARAVAQ
jgi:hypothetical protein